MVVLVGMVFKLGGMLVMEKKVVEYNFLVS